MRRSEEVSDLPKLDLSPPVCLDAWALTFVAGLLAGTVVPALLPALLLASFIVSVGAVLRRDLVPERWRVMAVICPVFVLAGAGAALLHAQAPDPLERLAELEPGEVTVAGEVASPPEPSGFGYGVDLQVEHLWYEDEEILRGGGLRVQSSDLSVGVGDRVLIEGEISHPEGGDFDYARYLSTEGISGVLYAYGVRPLGSEGWIGEVHDRTDRALGYGLRPEEASIVRGMLIGDRSRISEEIEEDFRRSGITHILAISGQHVAVLTAAIYFALRLFAMPLVVRNPVTLTLIWLYVLVAGAPPSAIRAAVVATLVLAAPLFGRQLSPLHFMTAMLAAVLAYNPQLAYNVGFQLSVAAVFGILLLRRPLVALLKSTLFRPFGKGEVLPNLMAVSLAAQIATTPVIAASFEEVSVIGVLTNLVAVPLSGPILTLGLVGALLGNVAPILAYPINASNGFLVSTLAWIAHTASSLPFATAGTPGANLPLIALFYAGCAPAVAAEKILPEKRWPRVAGLLVLWTAVWVAFVGVTGG